MPHPKEQNVFWARIMHDGFLKKKSKRLPNSDEPNEFTTILQNLRAFIESNDFPIKNIPEFCKLAPVDYFDPLFELVPEAYIESSPMSINDLQDGIEKLVRENAAFIIRYRKEER